MDNQNSHISNDGCEIDFNHDVLSDSDIDGFVLFADIAPNDVESIEKRIHDWNILNAS